MKTATLWTAHAAQTAIVSSATAQICHVAQQDDTAGTCSLLGVTGLQLWTAPCKEASERCTPCRGPLPARRSLWAGPRGPLFQGTNGHCCRVQHSHSLSIPLASKPPRRMFAAAANGHDANIRSSLRLQVCWRPQHALPSHFTTAIRLFFFFCSLPPSIRILSYLYNSYFWVGAALVFLEFSWERRGGRAIGSFKAQREKGYDGGGSGARRDDSNDCVLFGADAVVCALLLLYSTKLERHGKGFLQLCMLAWCWPF